MYVWKKDAKPEPASQLIKAILWGIAICIPVAFAEFMRRVGFCHGGEYRVYSWPGLVGDDCYLKSVVGRSRALCVCRDDELLLCGVSFCGPLAQDGSEDPVGTAHGIYDALAMSSAANPIIGGIAFFVLIYFCIKMHKLAYRQLSILIRKDTEE